MTARSWLWLAVVGTVACKGGVQIVAVCTTDAECFPNFHCETTGPLAGQCLCSNDNACPQDAGAPVICNGVSCQVKVGCVSNTDCNGQGYCDTVVGECVTGTGCHTDLDCPIGQICDLTKASCVPGCHSNGDCPLQEPCVCSSGRECQCPPDAGGVFVDPATYNRSTCEVGACRTDTCAYDTSLCPYNDDCTGTGDGGSVCKADPRANVICQPCAINPGQTGDGCTATGAQGADFCLIDLHGDNLFCGVDCSQPGQTCPSGYECDDVIILTQQPCGSDSACSLSKIPCTPGADANECPTDSQCVGNGSTGFCGGYCAADEGNGQGFCTCVTDSDCPKDTCLTSGFCQISQQPCVVGPSGDQQCSSFITCVDLEGTRGCFIGRNCAPTHGLHCPINVQQ